MIPVLYEKNETIFTHNGIGLLVDTISATVTEERNGSYELSLQYPVTGRFYSEIANGTIVKAKAKEYTLTFKAKCGTNNRCYAFINNGGNDTYIFDVQESGSWVDYSLTFTASGNTVILTIGTTGYYLYAADFMLVEGESKSYWTPAPNEIYTENVKVEVV